MSDFSPASRPGLIVAKSRIRRPQELADEQFQKWYNEVHVPDALATGGITHAARLEAVDPEETMPNLALYKIKTLGFISSPELKNIPMTHEMLPQGGNVHDYVEFDTRLYELVQVYELEPHDEAFSHTVMVAEMEPQPDGHDELDRWYRDEHNEQMSIEPGYVRTTRYKLVHHVRKGGDTDTPVAPTWLTLHEFDENNKLSVKVQALDPMTEWTKKILQTQKAAGGANYRTRKNFSA